MPGTFSQLYVQVVFAVGGRQNLIAKSWSQELYKYMSGIITAKNQKSIIVNGMPDHIHIFIGLRPSMAVSLTLSEMLRTIQPILLMNDISSKGSFFGRKDLERFLIPIHR